VFVVLKFFSRGREKACPLTNHKVKSSVPEFIDQVLGVKMIVFAKTSPNRSFSIYSVPRNAGLGLIWMRSNLVVVFKYWDCVEVEISWFSCPKIGHIRWQAFTKSIEFAKV